MKVKNNKAINNLALSGIKNNIKKYALLSIAVILTTLMFSSFFTIVGSILNELQLASMRRAGGSAHAEIKYLPKRIRYLKKRFKVQRYFIQNCSRIR